MYNGSYIKQGRMYIGRFHFSVHMHADIIRNLSRWTLIIQSIPNRLVRLQKISDKSRMHRDLFDYIYS
jgi:hypothetical protein